MTDEDADGSTTRETEPEDAFGLIGNSIRADILRVLGEAAYDEVPFSELRSRVDEDLDSGRFNYHLKQLLGQFIDREDEGYRILPEGLTLYRTIRAGTFNRQAALAPFDAGFDCYYCDARVEASYEEGMFEIACPDCDHVYSFTRAPPSAVEGQDEAELLSRIDQYNRHEQLACTRGVCYHCVNPLEIEFVPGEDVWLDSATRHDVLVKSSCSYCGNEYYLSVGAALIHDPAVIAFLENRGVDVASTPLWEHEWIHTDRHVTVESRDPWEVALEIEQGDDTLEVIVNEGLEIVEERRY